MHRVVKRVSKNNYEKIMKIKKKSKQTRFQVLTDIFLSQQIFYLLPQNSKITTRKTTSNQWKNHDQSRTHQISKTYPFKTQTRIQTQTYLSRHHLTLHQHRHRHQQQYRQHHLLLSFLKARRDHLTITVQFKNADTSRCALLSKISDPIFLRYIFRHPSLNFMSLVLM